MSEVLGRGVGAILQGLLNRGAIEWRACRTDIYRPISGGKARVCQKRETSLKAQVK